MIELKIVPPVQGNLALYSTIKIQVEKLDEWAKQTGNDPKKFILYVDGNAFKGLDPLIVDNNTKLQFDLRRLPNDEENRKAWTAILSRRPKNWTRDVPVTVGLENVAPLPSYATARLTVINQIWFWIFLVSFLAAIGLFWWLTLKSDVIRDAGPTPTGLNTKKKPHRKPYSLARTQMAFWFFIVAISFAFIWMVTSDVSNLTPSVLVLIGISAATGLGAAIVDATKKNDQTSIRNALENKIKENEVLLAKTNEEINALNAAVSTTPPPADLEAQKTRLAERQAEAAALQKEIDQAKTDIAAIELAGSPATSRGFIRDVLSDDDGVSFHRFQVFAWTIILIAVFIASVYNSLAMPEFDATLLALMGISGGTYIGFKMPSQPG